MCLTRNHLHITSPLSLCRDTIFSFVKSEIPFTFPMHWVCHSCDYSTAAVFDWGKIVLNIECGFKYHAVSSFAHVIECAATQNLNIGLMPLAMFSQLTYSGFFMILVSCCSFIYLFIWLASIHAYYYLLPNPFSLFLLLVFYFATYSAASLHLFWYLCCCLSLSNIVPQRRVFLFSWTSFFISSPSHSRGKFTPPRLCL